MITCKDISAHFGALPEILPQGLLVRVEQSANGTIQRHYIRWKASPVHRQRWSAMARAFRLQRVRRTAPGRSPV